MAKQQSGFHLLPVILIIAMILTAGLIAWRVWPQGSTSQQASKPNDHNQTAFATQYANSCKKRDVTFTSPPLKMDDLAYIRPLGAMLDGHVTPTDHVYVAPTNPQAPDNTYPVLMPADGTVVQIDRMPDQYVGDRKNVQLAPEDHRVVISFSCRYYAIYIHIHKLADPLAAQVVDQKPNQNKTVSIDLKAGDTVGYIGGDTFDWTPVDTEKTLTGFITPKLYEGESWKVHTISPFDLYTGSLKTQMEAKSLRTVPPIGGKIDYDQAGKLIGTWFRSGSSGYSGSQGSGERYWDGHLSVVPDYIDPSYTIVSIGNWEGNAKQFVVKESTDPATVTNANGMVKLELIPLSYVTSSGTEVGNTFSKGMHPNTNDASAGTIAFQVQSGEKLKVEKFPGKTPGQVTAFTSAAQMYER